MVRKGGSERHVIDSVKNSIANNIEANTYFYQKLADESQSTNQIADAARYKLIKSVYQKLCG